MKKSFVSAIGLVIALTLLAGIGVGPVRAAEGQIAVVYATGGLGDKSFNDAAHEGILRAEEELSIEFDQAEPSAVAEYETFLNRFASMGRYDLIISIGFDQADALTTVAEQYPDQKFALVDAVVEKPNVASFVYAEKERGFLMGVAAAMMTTKTEDPMINSDKKIGVIGGMKIPLIDENIAGYIAGAHYVDPDIEVMHSYVGSWADPAKGKELTVSMIENGVDVVWGAAGRSGLGVINAAKENDVYAIGADSDQGHLAPENVLTNGMKFVDNTVYRAIEQALNDELTTGINVLGIEKNGLGYTESLLPESVVEELEEVKTEIIEGEVEIPTKIEEARE
ncbi:BMP family ABC transporter substrate-binding protein [Candidatus Bipolaricaulota bacterium]|nr:BMP family ABC transporter substrate-binding protein [Candidatus Bipolaricaulota bacterium]